METDVNKDGVYIWLLMHLYSQVPK